MADFLEPDDGLVWTDRDGNVRPPTVLTDTEKIDLLETEVIRLGKLVRALEPLVGRMNELERKFDEKDRAERRATARFR